MGLGCKVGLVGHLTKMCISSKTRAYLYLENIPFYKRSMELTLQGVRSSLFSENYKFSQNIIFKTKKNCDLLFDPQTSGGLLLSVSSKESNNLIQLLNEKSEYKSIEIGFFSKKKEDGGITNGDLMQSDKNWELANQDKEFKEESGINMDKFPGWSEDQVKKYLESGWSEEQLAEWYQQQIDNNTAQD